MDAAPTPTDHHPSPREQLLAVEREIGSRVFERREEIRGFVVALLVGAHVLFLGKKGAAKSMLGRLLCDAVRWLGVAGGQDPYFRTTLGRDSVLDELFGPVSTAGFENDTFRRNTTGMLPEAKLGLIEEIYKSNPTVLNRLLTLLAEGLFKNGTDPERTVPLRLVVGTSNELPDERDDSLDAFHDRFLLRYDVDYMRDPANVRKMMERANSGEGREPIAPILGEEDLDRAGEEARRVDVSGVFDAMDEILVKLSDHEIDVSDRRREALVHLVKANAYMNGRSSATRSDLDILTHALWEDPDQRPAVAQIVMRQANPHAADAQDRFDRAADSYNEAMKAHREAQGADDRDLQEAESKAGMNANVALKQTTDKLLELRDAAKRGGADTGLIDGLLKKVSEMNEEVTSKCLGI